MGPMLGILPNSHTWGLWSLKEKPGLESSEDWGSVFNRAWYLSDTCGPS